MTQIQVKDSQWYRVAFNMPQKVTVYIGETKAEHMKRRKEEYDLIIFNREHRFSGFDDEPEREWDHE